MEVVVASAKDFHFNSTATSPYLSAPSSPKRFGDPFDYYCHYTTSAPTSPRRAAAIFASSEGPFAWDDEPRSPKYGGDGNNNGQGEEDFAFDFSGQLAVKLPDLSSADELFDKGKIRPLKPPPRLYNLSVDDSKCGSGSAASTPRSPKSPSRGLWSPRVKDRGKNSGFDPFAAAMVEATRERGRERAPASVTPSRSRKGARSLSPMRSGVGGFFQKSSNSPKAAASNTTIAAECLKSSGGGSRKWRLRDLLLFRSASEGRVTGNKSKDPLRKYTLLSTSPDSRNSSFRSTDSHGSMRKGSGAQVSAHEIHYVSNRAVSEEMKKKTALPFERKGLFGFLRLNHGISRGFHNATSFAKAQ